MLKSIIKCKSVTRQTEIQSLSYAGIFLVDDANHTR